MEGEGSIGGSAVSGVFAVIECDECRVERWEVLH